MSHSTATATTYTEVLSTMWKTKEIQALTTEDAKHIVGGFNLALRRAGLVRHNLDTLNSNGFKQMWAEFAPETKAPSDNAHLVSVGLVTESEIKSKWVCVIKDAARLGFNADGTESTLVMLFRREVAKGNATLSLREFVAFAKPLTEEQVTALLEEAEGDESEAPVSAPAKPKAISTLSFRLKDADPEAPRNVAARIDADGNIVTSNTKAELTQALAMWTALLDSMDEAVVETPAPAPAKGKGKQTPAEGFSRVAI